MSMYHNAWKRAAAMAQAIEVTNRNDSHYELDMWIYWSKQDIPPRDPRWMEAWLQSHPNLRR
jgi:hypothetical protein